MGQSGLLPFSLFHGLSPIHNVNVNLIDTLIDGDIIQSTSEGPVRLNLFSNSFRVFYGSQEQFLIGI
jgi:hypothetical protein